MERIPGRQTDRKTPLGELNWVFTAITDTIAWNALPRSLFQKLFRQDLLVASLFRNFLLAERIMARRGRVAGFRGGERWGGVGGRWGLERARSLASHSPAG